MKLERFFSFLSFCVLDNLHKIKCQIHQSYCVGSLYRLLIYIYIYHDFLDFKLKSRPLKSKTARLSAHRGRRPLRFALLLPASLSVYHNKLEDSKHSCNIQRLMLSPMRFLKQCPYENLKLINQSK